MDAIQQRHLTLSNDINTVPQLNEFIDGVCEEAGIDMATTMSLNLALEEAVVNVMSYAYPQGKGKWLILRLLFRKQTVLISLSVIAANPLPTNKEEVDDDALPAEARPMGGLGLIPLIRESGIMDEVKNQ